MSHCGLIGQEVSRHLAKLLTSKGSTEPPFSSVAGGSVTPTWRPCLPSSAIRVSKIVSMLPRTCSRAIGERVRLLSLASTWTSWLVSRVSRSQLLLLHSLIMLPTVTTRSTSGSRSARSALSWPAKENTPR